MYGEGAYGEGAYGETIGPAVAVIVVGMFGSLGLIEAPDVENMMGNTPLSSAALVVDANVLVVVVELELGQF